MKKSWEKIKYIYNKNFIEKETVEDKFCNNCNKQLDRSKSPCSYDEHLNEKDARLKTLSIALFIWIFTIGFYFALFSGLSKVAGKAGSKINLQIGSSFSMYKPGIDIMRSLEKTRYLKYIQRMYVQPKEENKMVIMIKPGYWGTISPKEKKEITSKVLKQWKKFYKNSDPEKKDLKPEVIFANT